MHRAYKSRIKILEFFRDNPKKEINSFQLASVIEVSDCCIKVKCNELCKQGILHSRRINRILYYKLARPLTDNDFKTPRYKTRIIILDDNLTKKCSCNKVYYSNNNLKEKLIEFFEREIK